MSALRRLYVRYCLINYSLIKLDNFKAPLYSRVRARPVATLEVVSNVFARRTARAQLVQRAECDTLLLQPTSHKHTLVFGSDFAPAMLSQEARDAPLTRPAMEILKERIFCDIQFYGDTCS